MTVEILDALASTDQPLDRFLRDWFRTRRFAGSKDRAAIADRVFDIARHRASYAWRMHSETSRVLVIASLLKDGEAPEAYFSGEGYGPAALDDAERQAIAAPLDGDPPLSVQGEYPPFLEPELARAFGADLLAETQALQARAPVDLRVNTLKRSRDEVLDELHNGGFAAGATPFSPIGLRLASATAALGASALFESGAFEFQDEAAQIAALLCAAKPDDHILDIAAGAGGKSLAVAAVMQNQGEIVACDIRQTALQRLALRAARAGAAIIRTHLSNPDPPAGSFNAVLVDAPCSGTGTWRRQPELRWRLTPETLADRITTQEALLDQAAMRVRAGGRLIYATCSVLPCENEDRIEAFLSRHAEFAIRPCADVWRESVDTAVPKGMTQFFKASPLATGTDGFFTCVMERTT